ncbi:MAG: DUF4347 domain-containing protein [Synechococcales cyanobacterium CRU_2_2]|nr:DUF4347 domain-containing protein [Synechococcales cyanobacterium CRU_2_2]
MQRPSAQSGAVRLSGNDALFELEALSEPRLASLVILDSGLEHVQQLWADVNARTMACVLHPEQDGVEQITQILARYPQIMSLHLVSHGRSGQLHLGTSTLSLETLPQYEAQIAQWSMALRGVDLLLYGCEVGQGAMAQKFLQKLHQLTGANIAASSQRVGQTGQGVQWYLDQRVGSVTAEVIFSETLRQAYTGSFVQVSLSTSSSFAGQPNTIVEDQGNRLTFRFDLDQAAPAGGLRVYVDSNLTQSLNRLDLQAALFDPALATNIDSASLTGDFDFTGFAATINPGATSATITIPVFDDVEDGDPTFDGLKNVTYTVKPRDQIATNDLNEVGAVSEYTVGRASSTVTFVDTASQLPAAARRR